MKTLLSATQLLVLVILLGCKAPTVNLSTEEAIKVEINVRLDVYQYSNAKPGATPSPAAARPQVSEEDPVSRRRNRMADIQMFKNERLVGENREGLLEVRETPEGAYGDYVRKTVESENSDRLEQMKDLAEARKTSLPNIQAEQAELWRNRAFKGEILEIEVEPGSWKWTSKEGE